MNLLTKTTSWAVASLLAASTAFGIDTCRPQKSFEQGKQIVQAQMMPAYNAPARIDVRGSWDVFLDASFIYWQLAQDNMEVAFADSLSNALIASNQIQGHLVPMDFDFKPGFKVGIGVNCNTDNWDVYGEYTRLHATNSTSTNGEMLSTGAAPLLPVWGHPAVQLTNVYNHAKEHWTCHFDFADLNLGRVYYTGTHLTFRPFFGARGAWILQNVQVDSTNTSFSASGNTLGTSNVVGRSHSWAVGPRAGIDTNWLIGHGIRFYGNANADVLYTKYKIQNKNTFLSSVGTKSFFISKESARTLRTHLDFELGLGWGSYFDNNNWHIDFSASYGFQVFFDQNMFPRFVDDVMHGNLLLPNGNLYAQGLTANVRLDF